MARSKQRKRKPEVLARQGMITSWRADLYAGVEHLRGTESTRSGSMYLELEGELTESLGETTRFSMLVYPASSPLPSQAGVSSVGSFTGLKPAIQGTVELTQIEFQLLATLAAANTLRSCHIAFQPPYPGHALIVNIGFSTGILE